MDDKTKTETETETAADEFAMLEARMIRTALTDAEWAELIQYRPSLPAWLEAYGRWAAEVEAAAG
ncbi:hypothetical protein [Streptomyces laurentii]|uniref:hypothetical protein n=1 Tax=Streptomyces laurentii TaxID=39478 RepID=UPI00340CEDD3